MSKATLTPFDPTGSRDVEMAQLVERVIAHMGSNIYWHPITLAALQQFDGGTELFRKDIEWNRRGVRALLEQARHWQSHQRSQKTRTAIHGRCSSISMLLAVMLKRKLVLNDDDLVCLLDVASEGKSYSWLCVTGPMALRQAQFAIGARPMSDAVRDALTRLADAAARDVLVEPPDAARVAAILTPEDGESDDIAQDAPPPTDAGVPSAVGRPDVLVDLKRALGIPTPGAVEGVETKLTGADGFELRADSPHSQEHELITTLFRDLVGASWIKAKSLTSARPLRAMNDASRGRVLVALLERIAGLLMRGRSANANGARFHTAIAGPAWLLEAGVELDRDGLFDALLACSVVEDRLDAEANTLVERVVESLSPIDLTDGERFVLRRVRCNLIKQPPLGVAADAAASLDQPGTSYWLVPGERWTDAVHADLASMAPRDLRVWATILRHSASATAARPTKTWRKTAATLLDELGAAAFRERVFAWFARVPEGRSLVRFGRWTGESDRRQLVINDGNAVVLRGLAWLAAMAAGRDSARALADLLATSIKKIPGEGPRAQKVANACVWALGELAAHGDESIRDAALAQLARLKARISLKTIRAGIEKALDTAAEAAGMSRDDLEELGVPNFDFEDGARTETLGAASAALRVVGARIVTQWTNERGRVVKTPPAAVRREYGDDVKTLKANAKDAEGVLTGVINRLDTSFLADRSWPWSSFRDRYLDHGLVSTVTRRLIWSIGDRSLMFDGDRAFDADGEAVDIDEDANVRLWHPVGRHVEEVTAWRHIIDERQITQPFKQAHREVYLLTDAERTTGVYSNRFAAHLVKQHQFNALCGSRAWHNVLRLMVDDDYPPATRDLHAHDLRAEFWIEGAGDDFGTHTNETGTYLYLSTDQVRFYRAAAAPNVAHAYGGSFETRAAGPGEDNVNAPVALGTIPPIVFSEIMRDVDLFVGVASVGNDPTWDDGGPHGRHRDYWTSFSFGELSATAQTRRSVLERVVPRLAIADRCTITDRFLLVRGSKRTYKIHLGSGNILMEPNDAYLCIVPASGVGVGVKTNIFLPFDGDRTLAIILSKAFMLADDHAITDPAILTQIGR